MRKKMVREFEVVEETTPDNWYRITIRDAVNKVLVDTIWYPTMELALRELEARGYREVIR